MYELKRYEVSLGGYASGLVRRFWTKAGAMKFFDRNKDHFPWAYVTDLYLQEELASMDNHQKYPAPPAGVPRKPGYIYDASSQPIH